MATPSWLKTGQREQVADLRTSSPIRPTASPVDTYYRPVANTVQLEGGGDFADLARSVGLATPVIQKELSEYEKAEQEKQVLEGAKARLANQKSFKQLQQEGKIEPGQNPWYWKGFMQQDGRISALEYDEAMRTAYMESDARNSDDPKQLQAFMAKYRQDWLSNHKDATRDWMDSFIPGIQKSENNLSAQHVAHRNKVLVETQERNTGIEISKLLAIQRDREIQAGNDPDLIAASRPAVAAQIQALTADLVRKGMSGKRANEIIAEQIIARGVDDRDPDYAREMLGMIGTGNGKVADITEIKTKIQTGENHIRSINRQEKLDLWRDADRPFEVAARDHAVKSRSEQEKTWGRQQKSEDREERVRGLTSDISNQIRINGVIDPNKLALLTKDDWRAAAQMEEYQRTRQVRAQEIIPDQRAVAAMSLRIATDPDSVRESDIWMGVRPGGWTDNDARSMSNELQQRLNSPARGILKGNRDYINLDQSLGAAISKNMETARTGAGEAEAGRARVRFRKVAEAIYADKNLNEGEKATKLDEAYLAELTRSNKIAREMMGAGGAAEATPTLTETKAAEAKKKADDAAAKAKEIEAKLIPQKHILQLIQNGSNEEARSEFDKMYGPGAAAKVLLGGPDTRYPRLK